MIRVKLIFIICFINFEVFSQDFSLPNEIDLGKFCIPDSNFKYNLNYYINLKFYKLSNEVDYIHNSKLKILYDSTIYYNGNFISSTFNNSFFDDTLIVKLRISAKYLDDLSKENKPLESEFSIYYIKNNSYNLDSQTVRLKHYLYRKKSYFILKEAFETIIKKPKVKFGDSSNISNDISYIINNTENDLIIDSVKHSIIGKNYFKFLINNNDTLKMPYIIKSFDKATLSHFYRLLNSEKGLSKIDLFCHFDNQNDLVLLSDTNQTFFDYYEGIYFNLTDQNLYRVVNNIDTGQIKNLKIFNYTDSILILNSIDLSTDNGLYSNCTYKETKIPITINPWTRFDIKDIVYSTEYASKYKLRISLGFIINQDSSFIKELVYTFESIDKITSINDFVESTNNFFVSPNPAREYIEINGRGINPSADNVRIYDFNGMEITTSDLYPTLPLQGGGKLRLFISHLVPGVYFIRVCNEVIKVIKI